MIERVAFDSNTAGNRAGALLLNGSKKVLLRNVDIYNNQAPTYAAIENGSPLTLSHDGAVAP